MVRRECALKDCAPRWESSSWSECSSSCDAGIQIRKVHCWKFMKPGVDSTVHTIECDTNTKPEVIKNCTDILERARTVKLFFFVFYLTSSWTENGSARTKAWAITYRFFNVNAYACVPIWSPTEYEHQDYPDTQACSEPWWTSPWSECSNKCGENSTRRRHVGCQVGHECAGVKPVTEEPCHANCVYRWKRGGWSLVSAASQALFNHIF